MLSQFSSLKLGIILSSVLFQEVIKLYCCNNNAVIYLVCANMDHQENLYSVLL